MVTIIQVNVSDAQKELIQKEAERNSLSCSSFVRTLVLSKIRNAYPQSDFEKNLSQENRETIKLKNDLGVFG